MLLRRIFHAVSAVAGVCLADFVSDDRSAAYAMINQARANHGVQPLAWDANLATYAQYWADEMAGGRQPFTHAQGQYRPSQGENLYEQQAGQCDASYMTPYQSGVHTWLIQEQLFDGQPITSGHEPWLHWCTR
ncbi:Pathogenesis-related protein 1A [Escovopsis weberi]|uniref:Pathogenesis-related protein 1A n=1 Tax=Escovopsis weberi TaxID=150374 RepID=A0A0M9VRG0_ESCWE|nr:Pathogenesis-related protein 1A [Escovopsis weberi]